MFDFIVYIVGFLTVVSFLTICMAKWPVMTLVVLMLYIALEIVLMLYISKRNR